MRFGGSMLRLWFFCVRFSVELFRKRSGVRNLGVCRRRFGRRRGSD